MAAGALHIAALVDATQLRCFQKVTHRLDTVASVQVTACMPSRSVRERMSAAFQLAASFSLPLGLGLGLEFWS